MVENLVVVATHGTEHIRRCLDSLGDRYPVVPISTDGYTTGAYLQAYHNLPAKNYFFMQDSMEAVEKDYLASFKRDMPKTGCVAWGRFPMAWDSQEQLDQGKSHYQGDPPSHGIFGPIFYTNRASLDEVNKRHLLPPVPTSKHEAQGSERLWAWAFHNAGMEVCGPDWHKDRMASGEYGIFRKYFMDRQ